MSKRRRSYYHRKRHKPGTAPGTLIVEQGAPKPVIHIMAYNATDYVDIRVNSADEIRGYIGKWSVLWVNVDGLGDADTVSRIGEIFNLHPLALEDTINVHQRPKTEDYDDYLYTVCRMANNRDINDLDLEQISIFMSRDFVISFQERPGDSWDPIRERIRRGQGKRLREGGADYLTYALLDTTIDDYFPLLEKYGDYLDDLEAQVLERPEQDILVKIQSAKRALYSIRHAVWPMRESVNQILGNEDLVRNETKIFMRDAQDHIVQVLDIVESYRERSSGLMDIYLSSMSARMNSVMKVLAVITTIFMPLTFIAGIYGMNFDYMPELKMHYAYPVTLGIMLLLAIGMIWFFHRLGWLSRKDLSSDQ